MSDPELLGRFVWYELMTQDVDAAKAFYTELIGWKTRLFSTEPMPYTLFQKGEIPVGGLMTLPEEAKAQGAPPHWLPYVGTPDLAKTAGQVAEKGGKVLVPPQEVPEVGAFSILQDPQGAVFAAYTPGEPSPPGPVEPGCFSWHELATTDHAAAFAFYSSLFGWEKTEVFDMGPAGAYQMYGRKGGPTLGGIYNKPEEMPAPPHWLLYIMVPDAEETVARVKSLGGKVLNGPMEVPGGDKVAQCMDPQGAAFAVHASP